MNLLQDIIAKGKNYLKFSLNHFLLKLLMENTKYE